MSAEQIQLLMFIGSAAFIVFASAYTCWGK